ncbi:hypothetical protein HPB49_019997 [Dermacentor silvarum]|uniref:Uncharacterized protein n=1 Tax=Dermacentor silvarum TaxID=543639 RepID=A0ACB8C576_DERSI|nr:hypothetical protein HPB49_019997 [Dermacentor silvarum]
MLTRHFAAPCNIRLQRHRFRERRQLQGEPITHFAIALRDLAALCDFATQADENMCEQFVASVTCPRLRERLLLDVTAASAHTRTASAPDLNAAAVSPASGLQLKLLTISMSRSRSHVLSLRTARSLPKSLSKLPPHTRRVLCREEAVSVIGILTVRTEKNTGIYIDVKVTSVTATTPAHAMTFRVNAGSAVSIMGEHILQSLFSHAAQLTSSHLTLLDFSRRKIPVLGAFHARVMPERGTPLDCPLCPTKLYKKKWQDKNPCGTDTDMDMPVGNARTWTPSSGTPTPDDALSPEPLVSPLPPCTPIPPTRPVSPLAGAMTSGLRADRGDESGDPHKPVESGRRRSTRNEDRQQTTGGGSKKGVGAAAHAKLLHSLACLLERVRTFSNRLSARAIRGQGRLERRAWAVQGLYWAVLWDALAYFPGLRDCSRKFSSFAGVHAENVRR